MSGGKVVNAPLAGNVNRVFRDLAADKGVESGIGGLIDESLGTAGAPGKSPHRMPSALDQQRFALQGLSQQMRQLAGAGRSGHHRGDGGSAWRRDRA